LDSAPEKNGENLYAYEAPSNEGGEGGASPGPQFKITKLHIAKPRCRGGKEPSSNPRKHRNPPVKRREGEE